MSTVPRLLVAYVLITAVVLISDRSKTIAGIVATAPINVPIVLWILWGKSNGDSAGLQSVAGSMLVGIVSTAFFLVICWYGFRQRWPFPAILIGGYIAWALVLYGPPLIWRLVTRI